MHTGKLASHRVLAGLVNAFSCRCAKEKTDSESCSFQSSSTRDVFCFSCIHQLYDRGRCYSRTLGFRWRPGEEHDKHRMKDVKIGDDQVLYCMQIQFVARSDHRLTAVEPKALNAQIIDVAEPKNVNSDWSWDSLERLPSKSMNRRNPAIFLTAWGFFVILTFNFQGPKAFIYTSQLT